MSAAEGTLRAEGIVKRFGGLLAIDGLSVTVAPGQIVALIGPNGAGKTTFFNCLTGILEPNRGTIRLGDTDITKWDTYRRAKAGIGRTFQRLEVFTRMTVRQNLQVAAESTGSAGVMRNLLSFRRGDDPEVTAKVDAVLDRLGLSWCASRLAGDLPTGVLRLVEIGRALCANPSILLLDEPASGLDATESSHLQNILHDLAGEGIGILLIEHDISFVLALAEHVNVMDFGKVIAEGPPDKVAADPVVHAAYLGAEAEALA